MSEPTDRARETALWRRWREAGGLAAGRDLPAPDAMTLAAYAEGRLSETAAEPVEAWLAAHAHALEDVLAAQRLSPPGEAVAAVPPARAVDRARLLVAPAAATVVPFRRPARAPAWRAAAAWGGMAAGILIVSVTGFALGTSAYQSLSDGSQQEFALGQDFFDPLTSLLSGSSEENDT